MATDMWEGTFGWSIPAGLASWGLSSLNLARQPRWILDSPASELDQAGSVLLDRASSGFPRRSGVCLGRLRLDSLPDASVTGIFRAKRRSGSDPEREAYVVPFGDKPVDTGSDEQHARHPL